MNCREAELRIARSLDEGLGPAEANALRTHLDGCFECRAIEKELRADQEAMRSLAGEEPSLAAIEELHAGVMAGLPGPTRRRWIVPLAVAASLAAAIVSVEVWRAPDVTPPAPIVAEMKPPELPVARPAAAPVLRPIKPSRQQAARQAPAAPPEPVGTPERVLMVKLETADPNVVIYWMVEETGELE